uniref:Remorin_C domain-containing protein n=1 Tax=Heterorhabditis bacteriophora TaxID=37862 RepID=A0A1I7XBE2_HETBA
MSSCSLSAPSSCESGKPCAEGPSTSQAAFPGYAQPLITCQPSPALAGSVPSSREATSPPETAGTDFAYFTTELANQAALEYEMERFESLLEWRHSKYRMRKEHEKDKLEQLILLADTAEVERKAAKRKIEDRPEVEPKKPYTDSNQTQSTIKKDEENPLRKMEMMTNSCTFNTSSCINEVIETPANGMGIKKDDRSAKLEKLGEMERQFEIEHRRAEWEREVQAHQVGTKFHILLY